MGTEGEVAQQLNRLIDAGATDVWAQLTPVGHDPKASLSRTRDLLRSLSSAS